MERLTETEKALLESMLKKCQYCEAEFKKTKLWQKYCKEDCRKRDFDKRHNRTKHVKKV